MIIKNIIFDLGGVIINIDYLKTLDKFRELGGSNIDEVYTQSKQDSLFDDFDIGKISAQAFRNKLCSKLNTPLSDIKFDEAWNAMLLDLPKERLDFIKGLRDNYRVFLFSNTNEIHLPKVFQICLDENGINSFDGYFERQYYSHIIGHRKPNVDAFKKILNENSLNANETLFIDDSLQHIIGARNAGLHAMHLTNDKSIFSVLDYLDELNQPEYECAVSFRI